MIEKVMRELGPKRVFEDVVQRVRLDIAKGRIKPGDKLPPDRGLVKQFGVGRGSIREAVRALEMFGLVTVKRGREGGVFFTPNCQQLARDSFSQLTTTGSTLEDSLEFRKAIEPRAAALAAQRATDDDIAQLRKSIRMMGADLESAKLFVESNILFHETIAKATRNPYFQDIIPQFLARTEIVTAAGKSETIERSLTQFFHTRIADAIAKHDADSAAFWMLGHLAQIDEDRAYAQEMAKKKTERKRSR